MDEIFGGDAAATRPPGTNSYGEPPADSGSDGPSAMYCLANLIVEAITGKPLSNGSQCD
ncbi:hypothetical protein [Roseateles sp.]|uniref:hypothetical protein n=1 Tax=Roseateles sp. TaxID=1971397 RepID=UPI003264A27A